MEIHDDYLPIVLLTVFVIRFPIFALILGSLRAFGSWETERFKRLLIGLPGDLRVFVIDICRDIAISLSSSGSEFSVWMDGTSPVYGFCCADGLRWESLRASVGRPLETERAVRFVDPARAGDGDALGDRAVELVVIVVEGALDTWVPGTARFCCPLKEIEK